MTQSYDWEPVSYRNLPHWMKRVSKPKQWINNTYTKIFYGKPFDYKVEYSVVHGKLQINYWRSASTQNPAPNKSYYRQSHRLKSYHYLLIFFVLVGVGFVTINQFNHSSDISSPGIPSPIITIQPITASTPLKTQSLTPPPTTTQIPTTDYRQSPKTTTYPYVVDGDRKSISFTTYGGLSDYFSKESHSYYNDMEKEVVMELLENNYQDEYFHPLIDTMRKSSPNSDSQAKTSVSLVQHIPYDWNRYYSTSKSDWYYPYETLHANKGVCSDKSLLLAYLLNKLGYDTVLFEFSDHMAVGIKSSSSYDFYDSGYAFIETTRPTIITYIPDIYLSGFKVSSNPHIIHLNGGKKVLDLNTEFQDANRMKQLEAMGQVLDQSNYAEWLRISNKYDLQYDT